MLVHPEKGTAGSSVVCPVRLCIMAILKNESHIISEWVSHYISEGAVLIVLIDNGSTDRDHLDRHLSEMQGWSEVCPGSFTTLYHIEKTRVFVIQDANKHKQTELYNHYFQFFRHLADWILVVDLDEFLYGRCDRRIVDMLQNDIPDDVGQISIPWKIFGSSGLIQQPSSVIQSFTRRAQLVRPTFGNIKSLIRVAALDKLGIHEHAILPGSWKHVDARFRCVEDSMRLDGDRCNPIIVVDESFLASSKMHLNHYVVQSLEWFRSVKMTRGSANTPLHDNVRTMDYFRRYDVNDHLDNELQSKRLEIKSGPSTADL